MKYQPLADLQSSEFTRIEPLRPAELRRRRLERLANILDSYNGPVRLFSQVEAVPGKRRRAMRREYSPFSIAYLDPVFRAEGLGSDTIGEASSFFGLSTSEAHELVCDCHYFGPVNGRTVGDRARYMASHPSLATRVRNLFSGVTSWSAAG